MRWLLIPTILATALSANLASAKHVKLSWKPFPDSPQKHGYQRKCSATAVHKTNPRIEATYYCDGTTEAVAFWNPVGLPGQTLEFRTPCGKGGFSLEDGYCTAHRWIFCIGDGDQGAPKVDCYAIFAEDDGYWPNPFAKEDVPAKVELWFEKDDPANKRDIEA